MKPTPQQTAVLSSIEAGERVAGSNSDLTVAAFEWSRDGQAVVAHRTVLVDNPVGNPRFDYRTELFRVQRDGTVARL